MYKGKDTLKSKNIDESVEMQKEKHLETTQLNKRKAYAFSHATEAQKIDRHKCLQSLHPDKHGKCEYEYEASEDTNCNKNNDICFYFLI